MPVVNELLDLPGSGSPTARVVVTLVGAGGVPVEGFTATATIVGQLAPTVTAGAWTATLVGNDDITPAGTVYKRTVNGTGIRVTDYFEVPTSGGPYELADLLTDPPASIATSTYAALAARVAALEASVLEVES